MAFLDDLDKKITQIGKTAMKKTKDMTDSVRITGEISSEEAKIDQCYTQIGRLYIQQTAPDNLLDQCQVLYNQIIELEDRIKALNLQKAAGSITINCPGCNAAIPAESAFCNVCGAKLEAVQASPQPAPLHSEPMSRPQDEYEPAATGQITCPSCGSSLDKGLEFCIYCGAKVEGAVLSDDADAELEAEYGQASMVDVNEKCPACGMEVSDGQVFCIGCGAKLS